MEETNKNQIPVTILTGFLGSGKTTFLNHLLQNNDGKRYAIIENEFGEQGIDSELVLRPDETIVELNNGCLCCTLNDNLYDILNQLFDRRDEFDEIIIEATGVADPAGLAQPFLGHPLIKEHFPLLGIICLVDAELVEDYIEETEEAINQITFSDVLLINKTDLVRPKYVSELSQKLQAINPLAKIHFGNKDSFPAIELDKDQSQLDEIFLKDHSSLHLSETEISFPVQKPHHHHHHSHTAVVSHTFTFDQPFDYQSMYQQLLVYLTFQSKGLYRMKGLVWMVDSEQQHIVQSVGKRLDFQEKRAWKATEKKQSTIVFIGKDLQRKGLEKLLNKCLAKDLELQK